MRSSNPVLRENTFNQASVTGEMMTVEGAVNKTGILLAIMCVCAGWTWTKITQGDFAQANTFIIGGGIATLVAFLVLIFKPAASPILAPVYAAGEGFILGYFSAVYNMQTEGIVMQALGLTVATLAVMLTAYRAGWIKITDKLRMMIVCATGGIALFYFVAIILGFFHITGPIALINSPSPMGIAISLIVVGVAAMNLVLDFDFIERSSKTGAPKYMEWYAAFALLVTLVWLYLEILRLLSKLNNRR